MTDPTYDMHDTPADLERWPRLAESLRRCGRVLAPPFRAADDAALVHQRSHRLLTTLAAGFGTLAVLLGVIQVAFPTSFKGPLLMSLEVVAVVAAAGAVAFGLFSLRLNTWLVERHKAELLRLAKFRHLSDLPVTNRPVDVWEVELEQEVQRVAALTARDMHHEIKREVVPTPVPRNTGGLDVELVNQLVEYYRAKRLQHQINIFRDRVERNERLDVWTKYLAPVLFFASVIAILIHFVIELTGGAGLHTYDSYVVFLAMALPAFAGGVRTFRSAYEFARNSSRYRAKQVSLLRLDEIMRAEADPWARVLQLRYCEEILDFEHREWCRLMIDSEWFA